jgi:hypothetical protein
MPPPVPILDDAWRSKENRLLYAAANRLNCLFLAANLAHPAVNDKDVAALAFPAHPIMQDNVTAPRIRMGRSASNSGAVSHAAFRLPD